MKYFTLLVGLNLLFSPLVAQENEQSLDLQIKSVRYINESIPTVSINFVSKELQKFDFIVAYASNYFEIHESFVNTHLREHIYFGLTYRF